MIIAYFIVFGVALCGLFALFSLKYIENASGTVFFPRMRGVLNSRTQRIRRVLLLVIHAIEHFPALMVAFGYASLHLFAVLVALGARMAEKQAHRVADFVSHKRKFQRRPTQSSFLKEVTTHKETLIVPEDVTKV